MKKLLATISSFVLTLIMSVQCFAASASTVLVGSDTFNDSITINVKVDYSGFSTKMGGLCAFSGKLNYDTNKLTLSGATAQSGFDLTQGAKMVLYRSTGVASGSNVLALTFKNKGLAANESTTISVTGVEVSDGDADYPGSNASKTVKYTPANTGGSTNTGGNSGNTGNANNAGTSNNKNNTTSTTNKNETNKSENSTDEAEKSNNSALKSLKIDQGEIKFSPEVFSYDVVVDKDVMSVTILAETDDEKASVTGAGTHKLEYGTNEIEVVVTAEDGSTSTYVIKVARDKVSAAVNTEEKKTNYLPVIIGGVAGAIAIIAIIIFVVGKKKKNKK